MWGNVMLNTQHQGLRDPENHPVAFKAYPAISIISQEEGILLRNRRLGNGVFVKGKVILFMGWESKTFLDVITSICLLCIQEASCWMV